jgi:hypothetical protein
VHRPVGEGIERLAESLELLDPLQRVSSREQRPDLLSGVLLRILQQPPVDRGRLRLEADHHAALKHQLAVGLEHEGPAAGGDHGIGPAAHLAQSLALQLAEPVLSVPGEDVGDRPPAQPDYLLVRVNVAPAQTRGHRQPDLSLAGVRETGQDDIPRSSLTHFTPSL